MSDKGGARVAFTARVPEAVYRGVKVRVAQTGQELQDAVTEALEGWLDGGSSAVHPSSCPLAGASASDVELCRDLLAVLRVAPASAGLWVRATVKQLAARPQ